ncbi:MOSC domain-containing protein YiiM [Marininema mesophilum]|uniref:MOSC domain-containing protein YiiM n=1 Tax=Marininema mesophilum TaxID=1048340 RepID=A0A1H3BNF6_9BACL|nr:MOSC domain-containing protein [Marininema mesophilum]SDX43211.1 MOSC domain-containing protein YiiM [Marininema mesophilum]
MTKPYIYSIQVGKPKTYETPKRKWTSGISKKPVSGPVYLGKTNLAGDGQGDMKNHGGPDKAVLAYGIAHYPRWQEELEGLDLRRGGFGENFTIHGQTEVDVCIGDILQIGEAVLQVAQTRMPCWKLDALWNYEGLSTQVKETGRSGWYLRVLEEGFVEEKQEIALLERTYDNWTIAKVNTILHDKQTPKEIVKELMACPPLAVSLRNILAKRVG